MLRRCYSIAEIMDNDGSADLRHRRGRLPHGPGGKTSNELFVIPTGDFKLDQSSIRSCKQRQRGVNVEINPARAGHGLARYSRKARPSLDGGRARKLTASPCSGRSRPIAGLFRGPLPQPHHGNHVIANHDPANPTTRVKAIASAPAHFNPTKRHPSLELPIMKHSHYHENIRSAGLQLKHERSEPTHPTTRAVRVAEASDDSLPESQTMPSPENSQESVALTDRQRLELDQTLERNKGALNPIQSFWPSPST